MLNPLRQQLQSNLTLRLIFGYGSLLALGLIAITLLCVTRTEQSFVKVQQQLGESATRQIAHLAVPAVAERDNLALQAMLARLVQTDQILSAAIYDVENQLLAQAGVPPSQLQLIDNQRKFSASIGLGDNITGLVSVTLATDTGASASQSLRRWLWLTGLLIGIGIIALSLRFAREFTEQRRAASQALLALAPESVRAPYQHWQGSLLSEAQISELLCAVRNYAEQLTTPSTEQLQQLVHQIVDSRQGRIYLLLHCKNLDLLKKQVSREPLATLLQRALTRVNAVALAERAYALPVAGDYLKFVFEPVEREQLAEALLRARTCGLAMLEALQQQKQNEYGISLNWSATLDWHAPAANELARNQQLAQDEQRAEWLCREAKSFELVLSVEAGSWLDTSSVQLMLVHSDDGLPYYRPVSDELPIGDHDGESVTEVES